MCLGSVPPNEISPPSLELRFLFRYTPKIGFFIKPSLKIVSNTGVMWLTDMSINARPKKEVFCHLECIKNKKQKIIEEPSERSI